MNSRFDANPPLTFQRYSTAYLCDLIYGTEPMSSELAEFIRTLRRDYKIDYQKLGYYLSESNPDGGESFGLGKSLVEAASAKLGDRNTNWI